MTELVPDESTRAALVRELPSLPLSYFEQSSPSPPDWDRVECAYLLFSDGYREQADKARDRGVARRGDQRRAGSSPVAPASPFVL
jgi:hypothetical protein